MIRRDLAHSSGPHVVLLRHGETEWSLSGQHTGRSDIPLTAQGEEQARAAARALSGQTFGLVLSSPLTRAVRTAEIAGFGPQVQLDSNLAEWDYGSYEGLTTPEISAQVGRPWSLWMDGVPDDGESAQAVASRAHAVLQRIQSVLDQNADVLVVSHGHFLRVLAATWLGLAPSAGQLFGLDTASVSALGYEHAQRVIRLWNRTPYTEL